MVILISQASLAQEGQPVDTVFLSEDVPWEKLLETVSEDEENSSGIDEITQIENNPVSLNTASIEELHRIPLITNNAAFRIIARRKEALFRSIDELTAIDGITPEMISFIRPYVTVRNRKEKPSISGLFMSRTSSEIEKRKGFLNKTYPGSSVKTLNKVRLALGDHESPMSSTISTLEIGALIAKDPGERNLADFSGGYGSITLPVFSTRLIVGDYQIEAAEGLLFWRASAFSKGNDIIAPTRKNGSGILPYSSVNENFYFKGIAASFIFDIIQVHIFYSDKLLNATIDSNKYISSLDQSGLFRTENEMQKQKSSRESMLGCRTVVHLFDGFTIGGTTYRTHFEHPLKTNTANNETIGQLWMRGMDVSYTTRWIDIFSELALDRSRLVAVIGGITYEPIPSLALSCVARKYPSSFISVHGNAFGESGGKVNNEQGIYVGVKVQPYDRLWISLYYDQFEHPEPTRLIPVRSHGNDFLTLAELQISNKYDISFRYKRKETLSVKEGNDLYGRIFKEVIPRIQENFRLSNDLLSSSFLRIGNRIEWAVITYPGEAGSGRGILLSQTIRWSIAHSLEFRTRVAFFETDSYDSRIYEYEDDLPQNSSNPALYGRGLRWYFIARYNISSKIYIASKYSQLFKEDVKSIGSGLDEIEGNTQSLLSMQMGIRF
jgi:DNA uptake protein ComE-like DNA-binding protein